MNISWLIKGILACASWKGTECSSNPPCLQMWRLNTGKEALSTSQPSVAVFNFSLLSCLPKTWKSNKPQPKQNTQTVHDLVANSNTKDASDEQARWDDLQEANKIMADDMGVIPVYQKAEGHLVNEKIKGIVHHAAGASWDYKWTYVEE